MTIRVRVDDVRSPRRAGLLYQAWSLSSVQYTGRVTPFLSTRSGCLKVFTQPSSSLGSTQRLGIRLSIIDWHTPQTQLLLAELPFFLQTSKVKRVNAITSGHSTLVRRYLRMTLTPKPYLLFLTSRLARGTRWWMPSCIQEGLMQDSSPSVGTA